MSKLAESAICLKLPVFPCRGDKKPAVPRREGGRGFLNATLEPAEVQRLFGYPGAKLIGVPTGARSGLDVLDLDYRHGAGEWEQANAHRLPETRVHRTQSGGRHLVFRHAPGVRNSAGSIAPGVDVRGEGGYAIFPPSSGYTVHADAEPVDWPDWLLEQALTRPRSSCRPVSAKRIHARSERVDRIVAQAVERVRSAGEGQKHFTLRNQALLLGGLQHLTGFSDRDAIDLLLNALPATVQDLNQATRTAEWGIENGKRNPIEITDWLPSIVPPHTSTPPAWCRNDPVVDGEPGTERSSTTSKPPEALVLSPHAPLPAARAFIERSYMHEGTRTIHHQNGVYYTWAGSHYSELAFEEMRAEIYQFLDNAKQDDGKSLIPFNPNRSKAANVLEALAAAVQLDGKVRPPAWLDAVGHPASELICCHNGLLHLPTGVIAPHSPSFFSLNALEFAYQSDAPLPSNWLSFLNDIWADDTQAIDALQEIFGLLLTADTRHQKAFLIVGPKRSGKGTIARVLTQLLGAANVCSPTLAGLSGNFGLAPLIDKRLAIISDARLSGKSDQQVIVERLLSITGEDGLTIDRKFRDSLTGKLDVRFIVLTNEVPRLTDSSGALASRFLILKMTRSFSGNEDLGLGAKLAAELPGILLWAIEGWRRLTARGYFVPPKSSEGDQGEFEDLGSPIGAFVRDRCVVNAGAMTRADDLYKMWREWCGEQGREHPGTIQLFGRDLAAAVPGLTVSNRRDSCAHRSRYYQGIGIATETEKFEQQGSAVERDGTRAAPLYAYFSDDPGWQPPDAPIH